MRKYLAASFVTAIVVFGAAGRLRATDLRSVLTDFAITSWDTKDGLPEGVVFSLAQDADGYLWVGSTAGVFRFDGTRFLSLKTIAPRSDTFGSVRSLFVSKDGSLWIGFGAAGGVSRFSRGQYQHFSQMDGPLPRQITLFLEDAKGSMWAGSERGLYRFHDGGWLKWKAGLPPGPILGGFVDKSGVLRVSTASGIYRLSKDEQRFSPVADFHGVGGDVTESATGDVWVTDPVRGFRRGQDDGPSTIESGRGNRVLVDRSDNLWVATGGQGLWRVRRDASSSALSIERATSLTGLLADGVYALLQDRDGNIWAGTTEGLNRLTRRKISQIVNLGLLRGIDTGPDGSIWIGAVDGPVRFGPNGAGPVKVAGLRSAALTALDVDERGHVLVATDHSVDRVTSAGLTPISWDGAPVDPHVQAIASDGQDGVWLSGSETGVLHVDGQGHRENAAADLTRGHAVAMRADGAGAVWIAFDDGRVVDVQPGGGVHVHDRTNGFDAGPYLSVYQDEHRSIWFGGVSGLTKYSAGHAATIHLDARVIDPNENANSTVRISSILLDGEGALWLGSRIGVIRISETDFEKAASDQAYQVHARVYNRSDGIAGTPLQTSNNTAIRATDGRLWFVTTRGITIIDPRALRDTSASELVRIEDVSADNTSADPRVDAVLSSRIKRLQIDYTTVSLSPQTRTRFRYRLEGFDSGWTEAGSRHQAIYTNLPPGRYRFRVAVDTGEDSPQREAVWSFSIPPAAYETLWFRSLLVAVLAAVVVGAWRLRMRRVRHEFALLIGERARLSREIHDTLLQGLVGVAVQCKTVAALMDMAPAAAKEVLENVRGHAERSIRETRASIWNLRSPALDENGLAAALEDAGARITVGRGIEFQMRVTGVKRRCPAQVEQQLLRIGQEALTNVVRHSGATTVTLQLDYAEESVRLCVVDNGHGFVRSVRGRGLGITSMRERTEQISGRITVTTSPDHGTEVCVAIPRLVAQDSSA